MILLFHYFHYIMIIILEYKWGYIMKIRDLVFLVIGGLLVISGMVLNSVLVTDAEAQDGDDTYLKNVFCQNLVIKDKNGKPRGVFGLSVSGDAILSIYGDDGKSQIAYLGTREKEYGGEMMIRFYSKSTTDKRGVSVGIGKNGGRFDSLNKMGEGVVRLGVGNSGGGLVDLRDKYGYEK